MMKVTLERFGDVIAASTLLGRIGSTEVQPILLLPRLSFTPGSIF